MFETMEDDKLVIRAHHCSAEFLKKVTKLRDEDLYIDVRIRVRDDDDGDDVEKRRQDDAKVIKAHKLVLSCCSPYFEAMFSNKFADNGNNKTNKQHGRLLLKLSSLALERNKMLLITANK